MVHPDPGAGKRLDGWKSIAAYFNRDRTTAMRWARERGLPIRRMPGGKQGSVFAFEQELAAWATQQQDIADPAIADEVVPVPAVDEGAAEDEPAPAGLPATGKKARRAPAIFLVLALAILASLGTWAWLRASPEAPAPAPPTSPRALEMPADPAVARDYVAARDAWARRTPADLDRAIALYEQVIRRAPAFAPAHAGLAEAWLILREYGGVDEATAYRNARRHATTAYRLDPTLPSAHRALAFIAYWWDGQPTRAGAGFRRALSLDDRDAQTHFWYANMLADVGRDPQAQAEYEKARLLAPGSRVIEVEQACSHWQAGRDDLALQQLVALAKQAPDDATIRNCLAWVYISRGDIAKFAEALSERARLRREPRLMRLSAALNEAVRRDPETAVRVLVAEGRREIAAGERRLRETPAFFASAMRDREALVQLLTEASDLGERWPSVPVTRRIAASWRDDAEVQRLLRRVTAPAA